MRRIVLFILGSFLLGSGVIKASNIINPDSSRSEMAVLEDTLGYLSYLIVNDSLEENRFAAVKKFIPTLVKALKKENSFDYSFERLKNVSIQYAPDSTFRIFTWQLYVNADDYRYYGAIQMNDKALNLIPLIDRSFEVEDVENTILSADKWYGSVYYNIKSFDTPEGPKYLLFGFDGYSFFTKRKVVDVLQFKDGKAIFGAPVFISEDPNNAFLPKNRLVMTYSAEASIKLNYDEHQKIIIHDHLIQAMSSIPGQGPVSLPDGSYEGYKLKDGHWTYVSKIYDHVYENEEATRVEPILNTTDRKKKKDLFGNK
jgi:hypothetical protein